MIGSIWALMVFAFLAGGSHVCAQTQQTVSGEWVGNIGLNQSSTLMEATWMKHARDGANC